MSRILQRIEAIEERVRNLECGGIGSYVPHLCRNGFPVSGQEFFCELPAGHAGQHRASVGLATLTWYDVRRIA